MWLSLHHKHVFDRLCNGVDMCSVDQLREMVFGTCWSAVVKAADALQQQSVAASMAMERTFAAMQTTRALRAFVRQSGFRLQEAHAALRSQCALPSARERYKRLRKEALRHALWAEGVRATIACCVELVGGESVAALALECTAWLDAEESARQVRLALFELRNGRLVPELRRRPEIVADCRHVSSFFADDVFLVPGHQVATLLVRLSAFVSEADSYEMTSVTLDTLPELEDYQQVCSGSGVAISRLWWKGETAHVLTLERHLLNDETGELEREQCVVSRDDLSDTLLDGCDAVTRHIVAGQRVPVAASRFDRRVLVDSEGLVNVIVDTAVSFATLTGSWQDERLLAFRNAYAFPHAVVTVHVAGRVREDLPWLKKMYRLRELAHLAPHFHVMTACVACCYGDASYPFELVENSAVAALKERGREQRNLLKSYSAEEEAKQKVLFTAETALVDPKNYWTTERTLHSWVHTAIFVALNAASLYGATDPATKVGGAAIAGCAILLALYATGRWLWRSRSLASEQQALTAFVDRVAPVVAVLLVVLLTAVSVGTRIAQ